MITLKNILVWKSIKNRTISMQGLLGKYNDYSIA